MYLRHSRRQVRSVICLVVVLGLVGDLHVGVTRGSPQEEQQKGEEALGNGCTQCHRLGPIMIQRKTAEQWRDTIYSMISRGAQVMPDEIEPLTAYLASTFGLDSPPPVFESSGSAANTGVVLEASLPDGPGQAILSSKCMQCHSLGIAVDSPRSEDEWKRAITRMVNLGASLSPEEQRALLEYLTKNFGF